MEILMWSVMESLSFLCIIAHVHYLVIRVATTSSEQFV